MTSGMLQATFERRKYRILNGVIIVGSAMSFLFFFIVFIDPSFLKIDNMVDAPTIGSLPTNK